MGGAGCCCVGVVTVLREVGVGVTSYSLGGM